MNDQPPTVALIGLGEVGIAVAGALRDTGVTLRLASRPSPRAGRAAAALGLPLAASTAEAVADADLILILTTGASLPQVAREVAPAVRPEAIVADMTSAAPADVVAAAQAMPGGERQFVDVAIMGAVSLHGLRTPLLATGPAAGRFATLAGSLGFNIDARPRSAVGDASKLKLLRSVFAKGLDAVVIEALVMAQALGLREDLVTLLADFDRSPLREHIAMYLRTHPLHAARRGVEMQQAEAELDALGLPSFTTRAAIARYARTAALAQSHPLPEGPLDAVQAVAWLLSAERAASEKAAEASGTIGAPVQLS